MMMNENEVRLVTVKDSGTFTLPEFGRSCCAWLVEVRARLVLRRGGRSAVYAFIVVFTKGGDCCARYAQPLCWSSVMMGT